MKTQFFLLLGVFFCGPCAWSQTEKDSLLAAINSAPRDTNVVHAYNRLSYLYTYFHDDIAKAHHYADSAYILAETLDFEKGMVKARYSEALVEIKKGQYEAALEKLQAYAQYYAMRQDSGQVVLAHYSMAIVYGFQGDYQKKLNIQLQMMRFYEKQGVSRNLGRTLMSLGNTYRQIGKYEEAKNTHTRATEIFKQLDPGFSYAMSLQNLANVYQSTESYDTALVFYQEALQIIRGLDRKVEEAYILTNLGYLYDELGQYSKALQYQLQALETWKQLDQPKDVSEALFNVGRVYLSLKSYDRARDFFEQALTISQRLGLKELTANTYQELSNLEVEKNEFRGAFKFITLSHQIRDSIFNEENQRQINELQTRYETEKKNQQIAMLAQENELKTKEAGYQATLKKYFIASLILTSVVGALMIYTLRQRLKNQKLVARKNQELKEANFKRQLSDLEMKALRAQINPHFIFNSMSSINQMILAGNIKEASIYLTKFSKLIRLILENAERSEVTLKDELTLLQTYVRLERLRFQGEIALHTEVDPSLDPESTYLPSMVLQPFVENAIWHGLRLKNELHKGIITIKVKQENNQLICQVEDNGVGREKAMELQQRSLWKSKSLGLKITEQRLRLLGRELHRQWIHITDLKDKVGNALGTRVEVSIPT